MAKQPTVAVIGSVNIDICGRPDAAFVARDSNPGAVTTALGGVGANIARNLALLGCKVSLVTALGGDAHAALAREQLAREGLDLSVALEIPEARTSTYLYITDANGDMVAAVADMKIQQRLTPDFLRTRLEFLNAADAVVVDANLSEASLRFVGEAVTAPLFADAVSAAKAPKLLAILPRLTLLKLNRLETEALTGIRIEDEADLLRAGKALLARGLNRPYITLGAAGALCLDAHGVEQFPALPPARLVNTTGAGDAFTAALVWSRLQGMGPHEAARAGLAAATIALESEQAVNPELTPARVRQKILENTKH